METRSRKSIFSNLLVILLILGLTLTILNLPLSTKKGVNYAVYTIRKPLYIKLIEFLARDYNYRQTVKLITKGCNSDEEKIIAIFDWTRRNIRRNIPKDWPVVDDHVWNIIIRGYGTDDQLADVFTTLSTYAGFPAVMYMLYSKDSGLKICISAVYYKGSWRLMDTFYGIYFRNGAGEIASIDDMIANSGLIEDMGNKSVVDNNYLKLYKKLLPIKEVGTTKAQLQMPIRRLIYEIKRSLRLTETVRLFYGAFMGHRKK